MTSLSSLVLFPHSCLSLLIPLRSVPSSSFTSSIVRASDLEGLPPPRCIHLAFSALLWPTPGERTSSFQRLPYFSCTVPWRAMLDPILTSAHIWGVHHASLPETERRTCRHCFQGIFFFSSFFQDLFPVCLCERAKATGELLTRWGIVSLMSHCLLHERKGLRRKPAMK